MSESESGTAKEVLSQLMNQRGIEGAIALKGLPATCKTEVAQRIGRWAHCAVLCNQDFLGDGAGRTCHFQGAEADFSPPTAPEKVERRHRKAFTSLLSVAHRILYEVCNCVVIKASLNTPFELRQLLQLRGRFHPIKLVIIECKVRNKYLWKLRFDGLYSDPLMLKECRSWYRPRNWDDIENGVDDDLNLLPCLLESMGGGGGGDDGPRVAWLRVDPFYDLFLSHNLPRTYPLPDEFNDAIKYLLTAPKQELPFENPYVADYNELRQFLFDKKLKDAALKGRSRSCCGGDCVFKYWDQVPEDYEVDICGVCVAQISSKPAYTCYFCVTSMHKTCAERFPIRAMLESPIVHYFIGLNNQYSVQNPCKDCQGRGREFSKECTFCLFQDRLKCHLLPPIFNHDSHQHFLSIQLHNTGLIRCKACRYLFSRGLGCKRCAFYCDFRCAFLPLELKHEHGGHEHVMKLMYTRDGMEDEEDPCWCDRCYKDMDPELWFYFCPECPHYVVHLECSRGYDLHLDDPKMIKFVEQLQSQLDNMHDEGNSIEPC